MISALLKFKNRIGPARTGTGQKGPLIMVLESLRRLQSGEWAYPALAPALACLQQHLHDAPGRYSFDGGFLLLQQGTTRDVADGEFEAHRAYLDVQVLLEGTECLAWAPVDTLAACGDYEPEKDKQMFAGSGAILQILPGTCFICWPNDAHKACRDTGTHSTYRKAVLKLPLVEGK